MNYQYHITVNPIRGNAIQAFDSLCREWGGKAILILLPSGDYAEQPMLSLTVERSFDLQGAITEANLYARRIDKQGYQTRRVKIEVPAMDYGHVEVQNSAHTLSGIA
ncbi:MAG: hypothetical protein LIP01_13490 [Tannerellaceae bacterium]|nr:hypothetical protein [Tannerellaceae bacterium]